VLAKTNESVINISLNEMYFIHNLLNQHLDVVANDSDPIREILSALGPAPPLLPRKDNANVDLKLYDRYKNKEDDNPQTEQIYTETKHLLFAVLKSLPNLPQGVKDDFNATLEEAANYGRLTKDGALIQQVENIKKNCKILVEKGILRPDDNYAKLRKDAAQEFIHYEQEILRIKDLYDKLVVVLNSLNEHTKFLRQTAEAYKQYLDNVRENCSGGKNVKEVKKKTDKNEKKGSNKAYKYSHAQLDKDGIIIESEVPNDSRRASIFFVFTSPAAGVFEASVLYKTKHILDIKFQLDDLLEKQHNNQQELETDFLKLNLNLLVHFLNKLFIADHQSK